MWALTLFVLPFSFAIAILKDVPDAEGDRRFRIATFTLRLGAPAGAADRARRADRRLPRDGARGAAPARRLPAGRARRHATSPRSALLWRMSARTDPHDPASFTRFYMGVWKLFFLEYALVPLAAVLG